MTIETKQVNELHHLNNLPIKQYGLAFLHFQIFQENLEIWLLMQSFLIFKCRQLRILICSHSEPESFCGV